MSSIVDEIKESFKQGSVLTRLIYINIGVFLVVRIVNVFAFLSNQNFSLVNWLALPSDIHQLAYRPWTMVTYMFLHFGFFHILFNILWLYWLGKIFLFYFNEKQLLGVYLLGGFFGGIFYLAAYNFLPAFTGAVDNSVLLGASASVVAIVVAVAVWAPNHPINLMFIGAVKMKYVALFTLVLYVIGISGANSGGNLAHIGGAFLGMIFVLQYRKNMDLTSWINQIIDKLAQVFKPRTKIKVTYKGKPPVDDIAYNKQRNLKQEEINRVLEKISKSGYDSLTKEEKELLFKMGK